MGSDKKERGIRYFANPYDIACMIRGHVVQFQDMLPNWLPISIPCIKSHHIPDILQSCNTLFVGQTPVEVGTAPVEWRSWMYSTIAFRCILSGIDFIQQFHTTWMYSTSHSIQNRRDSILPAGMQGHAREQYDGGSAIYIWYTKGKNHFLRPLESKILVQPLLWWIPFRRRIQLTISPPPVIASARGLPRCARLPADSQTIHFKLTASTTNTICPWNCENLCMILLLVWVL